MLVQPPSYLEVGGYSARVDRLRHSALLTPEYTRNAVSARQGVVPSGVTGQGFRVIARPTADKWVRVLPGLAWVNVASVIGGGVNIVNDGEYDVRIPDAHPSLNRKDLVVARVKDAVDSVDLTSEWVIEIVEGTPAVTPFAPLAGASRLPLAVVDVAAGALLITSGDIHDARPLTVAVGGILPTATQPASTHVGQGLYRTDLDAMQVVDNAGRAKRVFDDGMGFAYGTLGFAETFRGWPGDVISALDLNDAASALPGMTVNFVMPTNVPTNRRIVVIANMDWRMTRCKTVQFQPRLDGGEFANEPKRELPLPLKAKTWGGAEEIISRHFYTCYTSSFVPPPAGAHTLTLRAVPEASLGETFPIIEFSTGKVTVALI